MPSPSPFAGTPAPVLAGKLISSTTRLDLYRIEGGLTITALLNLAPQFEQAIDRVGARMGAHAERPRRAELRAGPARPVRPARADAVAPADDSPVLCTRDA